MTNFEVSNTKTGFILGTFSAESAEAAIDAAYRDAGYDGAAGYESETGASSCLQAHEVA